MSFVYPVFLVAAAALAIPIVIHLFNFRRYKTIYFSNVSFLKEIKEETSSRSKLKHWLVLLSRLLLLLFLVLAFAQPFIPISKGKAGPDAAVESVSIYVDNSFSMSAEDDGVPLLNKAKDLAKNILNAYGNVNRFQVLTNDFSAREQIFVSKEEALGMIDEIKLSPQFRTLKDVQALQKKLFADEAGGRGMAYWISDFQQNSSNFEPDTALTISLLPLKPSRRENVYIDSIWMEQPVVYAGQPNRLMVRVINNTETDLENSRVTLTVNGQSKAIADISVAAGGYAVDSLNFTVTDGGWCKAKVHIMDYPVVYDDDWFLAFEVVDQVNVLAVNEDSSSRFIDALFKNDPSVVLDNRPVNRLDYSRLSGYNLIILYNLQNIPSGLAYELKNYLKGGGTVLLFPSALAELTSYNAFFTSIDLPTAVSITTLEADKWESVSTMNKKHPIFRDVFEVIPDNIALPKASLYFNFLRTNVTTQQALLTFRNGRSFLNEYTYELGNVFICSTPLNQYYTDFPFNAIFVPLLYKMALTGGQAPVLSYEIGEANTLSVIDSSEEDDVTFKIRGENLEFIPQQRKVGNSRLLTVNDGITEAGEYTVLDGQGKTAALVAFNFNRQESAGKFYSAADLKDKYPDLQVYTMGDATTDVAGMVNELDKGIALWKLCIIFVLIFAGAEVLLLRFMK